MQEFDDRVVDANSTPRANGPTDRAKESPTTPTPAANSSPPQGPRLHDNANPGFLGPADATESRTQLAYDYDTRQALKA